jgi:hypothetical protein
MIELPTVGTEVVTLAPEAVPLWVVVAKEVEPVVDRDVLPSPNPSLDASVVLLEGVKLGTFSNLLET